MPDGTVKWFDEKKGFGFILAEDGTTLFVHYSDISGDGRRLLKAGQKVSFRVASGNRGVHAASVRVAVVGNEQEERAGKL